MKIAGKILSVITLISSLFFVNCGEDRTYEYLEITKENQWIYAEMKESYLWRDSIKPLSNKNFFGNSQTFFKNLLYKTDKTSYFTDTIPATSYGISFTTMRDPLGIKASDIYALVLAVDNESPAYKAGIRRGTWISKSGKHSISLGNNSFLQQGDSVVLYTKKINFNDETATYEWQDGDTLKIEPSTQVSTPAISLDTIYTVREKVVGYIVCNRFDGEDYLLEMQNILSQFNNEGVKELIIDLRYNSGGSLNSAVTVAGMLLPTDKDGSVFGKLTYSLEDDNNNEYIVTTNPIIPELENIYILSTGITRGVAEAFIAGMRNADNRVRVLGKSTMGDNLYTEAIESPYRFFINPVVARLCSPDGNLLPSEGVYADFLVDELTQLQRVYPLGDQQEYMLYSTIHLISTGTVPQSDVAKVDATSIQLTPHKRSIIK